MARPAASPVHASDSPLFVAIRRGLGSDAAQATRDELTRGMAPLDVIERGVMPALTSVGDLYERGTLFLPQLLQSANAAQAAFDVIREHMPAAAADNGMPVVLATVKGDVHDIGKNIVRVLLQNYGFRVIDLGRDVAPEQVLAAAREHEAPLVGLSALMTTTVPAMRDTIALLKRELPDVKIVVGGAVLTEEYAARIGADRYAKDALATVKYAQEVRLRA